MSLIYAVFINNFGFFRIGRFIDLLQADTIIWLLAFIAVIEVMRWRRISK